MRILHLEKGKQPHLIEIKAVIGDSEFEQLSGNLDHLCLFSTRTAAEPATTVKTGARHSYAKWLLFPVKLRRQFRTDELNFDTIDCRVVKYLDKVFVIYGIPRKDLAALKTDNVGKP